MWKGVMKRAVERPQALHYKIVSMGQDVRYLYEGRIDVWETVLLPPHGKIGNALLSGFLALVFAVGLAPLFPAASYAADSTVGETIEEQIRDSIAKYKSTGVLTFGNRTYDWATEADDGKSTLSANYPSKYDLRDYGVVTPVKNQSPWGTCWGFAAIAASETSILSELKNAGYDYSSDSLFYDLSERQLAWFAYSAIPEGDSNGQGGEGQVNLTGDDNAVFNTGGLPVYATSIFSSGIGPLPEALAPYQNDEGYILYDYLKDENGDYIIDEDTGWYVEDPDAPLYYSDEGTWSLSEDLRYVQLIELEETYTLPAPADWSSGSYEYNPDATDAIKDQLMAGRAVSIGYYADQSLPNQISEEGYMNPDTWAQYTYEEMSINHAVTIVGWDDTYSASNFGNVDEETGTVPESHQPPGDGAWIVKNSWGASDNEFPNKYEWGIDGDGYFYLSYYDQSLVLAEAFDYDINSFSTGIEEYYNNAYDYMPSSTSMSAGSKNIVSAANVFTAEGDQTVRTLTCETTQQNTQVTYQLYSLEDGYTSPIDGTLVAEVTETYEYGGFHRVDLNENQQLKVPEGGTFSVVVTQKVGDTYYCTFDMGISKTYVEAYNEALKESYTELVTELVEQYFTDQGLAIPDQDSEEWKEVYEAYWMLFEAFGIISYVGTASNGVVNEGESYLYTKDSWDDWVDEWIDEADLIAKLEEESEGIYTYDNFAIKAYSDVTPFADETSLEELGNLIESASILRDSVRVSEDGSDIYSDELWVTQEVWDNLELSIENASALYYAAQEEGSTVTEEQIQEAFAALQDEMNAFQTAERAGLLAPADELKALEDAVKEATSDIQGITVSADGTDVPMGTSWATQEAVDAYQAAIDAAITILEKPDATLTEVQEAKAQLASARDVFLSSVQDGTMIDGGGSGDAGDGGSDGTGGGGSGSGTGSGSGAGTGTGSGSSKPGTKLPQTGDDLTNYPVVGMLGLALVAAAGAMVVLRRMRG